MIGTALLALGLMGIIVTWEKQLPSATEPFDQLPARRRVLSVSAIVVSVLVVAAFVVALVAALQIEDAPGYGGVLLLLLLGLGSLGFGYLLVVSVARVRRSRRLTSYSRSDA